MKKSILFFIIVASAFFIAVFNCASPDYAGEGYYYNDNIKIKQKCDDVTTDGNYFYFTYDDSASTVAVELAKYKLKYENILPYASLNRPWEFLNYESFIPTNTIQLDDVFSISAGVWNRTNITNEATDDYLLGVYVASPTISLAERRNTVLTLVVDVSGSMGEYTTKVVESTYTKLDVMKYGLDKLIDYSLKNGDVVNLIKFASEASVVFENKTYDSDKSYIKTTFANLNTEGSTNLNAGISLAYQIAQNYYDSTKMNRVIMITDAYANTGEVDPTTISQKTSINNMEGIYFSGVGVGSDFNEAFLNELTEAGKGAYFSVITNSDSDIAFRNRFIALLDVAARDVKFKLEYPALLKHEESASEELSQDESLVKSVNFSYNTDQYFFEKFSGLKSNFDTIKNNNFTLTIYYKDPKTYASKEVSKSYTINELLNKEINNIKDAEIITLLCKQIGKLTTYSKISEILNLYYAGYTSTLFDEYKSLIEKYNALSQ